MGLYMRLLLSLCLALLLGSCEQKAPQNELGPATTADAIGAAQRQSLLKLNPDQVKEGQSTHIAETQEVITSDGPIHGLLKEWTLEVAQREDFKSFFEITTLKKEIDYSTEDKPVFEFKNVFIIEKDNLKNHQAHKVRTLAEKLSQAQYSELTTKKSAPEITEVSFHNLATQRVVMNPPENVSNSPDCRGLNPCKINADRIAYDIVFHFSDGSTRKHQIEWFISSEVPFFSAVLKQCATTLVPVEDVRVLVKQCQEVVDFSF